jgi:hydrogenase-4 component E
MAKAVDMIMILLIFSNLVAMGSSRLRMCIRTVAMQGLLLGLMLFVMEHENMSLHLAIFGVAIIIVKTVVFPWMLSRAMREVDTGRAIEPLVGYGASVLAGPLALIGCIWLSSRFSPPVEMISWLVVPAAFFTIASGLFLIIARKSAVMQVLGYLVLENGIYAFGLPMARQQQFIVELGILLDVFVAVFVMGIMVFHINREFDHIETDRLTDLKG